MKPTICKSCGAEIIFIDTNKGSKMPCDPDSYSPDELEPTDMVVTDEGRVCFAKNAEARSVCYISHFATCPDAEAHRKK